MGSIVEREKVDKDGKPYVEFRVHIRRKGFKSKSKIFRSKREAQRWLRDNEATSTLTKVVTGKTFTALLDDFVALSGCNYARHSQLDFWRDQFAGRGVADITHGDIAGARLALQRKPAVRGGVASDSRLTNSSINRYLAALSAVFSFAVDHGVIDNHPMRGGKVRKLPENSGRQRTLSEAEEALLLEAARQSEWPMMWLFLRLLLTTGARRSEANRLRWSDVRLADKVAILPTTKNGEPRALPLVADVRDALVEAFHNSGRFTLISYSTIHATRSARRRLRAPGRHAAERPGWRGWASFCTRPGIPSSPSWCRAARTWHKSRACPVTSRCHS